MSKEIKEQVELVKKYLIENHGWKDPSFNFVHAGWIESDLENNTPVEVARIHSERCERIGRSVAAEFKDKHSAMTTAGASAYADKWN